MSHLQRSRSPRDAVPAISKAARRGGTRITHLAEIVCMQGHAMMIPDYSDTHDLHERRRELPALATRMRSALTPRLPTFGRVPANWLRRAHVLST